MLSPKQNRATLMRVLFCDKILNHGLCIVGSLITFEKLFNTFPMVLSVKTRNAEIARVQHATREMNVEIWVTFANRSRVGIRMLP